MSIVINKSTTVPWGTREQVRLRSRERFWTDGLYCLVSDGKRASRLGEGRTPIHLWRGVSVAILSIRTEKALCQGKQASLDSRIGPVKEMA